MLNLAIADRRWDRKRVIVAAPGPSLTAETAAICNSEIVLAVNDSYKLFPKASVLYACDAAWWDFNKFVPGFAGERWTSHSISPKNDKRDFAKNKDIQIIEGKNNVGFSRDPKFIHYGNNSGFQAVNLAILFGAAEIVLIGFDMKKKENKTHFFGEHKAPLRATHSFSGWINHFENAAKLLSDVRIVNATLDSALTCFQKCSLEAALGRILIAAD